MGVSTINPIENGSQSLSYRIKPPSHYKSKDAIEIHAFEFINVEDKDGTRRAKSHAAKQHRRRKKAEGLRLQRLKGNSSRRLVAATPATHFEHPPGLSMLYIGQIDPFHLFPTKLESEEDLGLVHHCKSLFGCKATTCC